MSFYGYTPIANDYSYIARAGEGFGKAAAGAAGAVGGAMQKKAFDAAYEALRKEKLAEAQEALAGDEKAAGIAAGLVQRHYYRGSGETAEKFNARRKETDRAFAEELAKHRSNTAVTGTLGEWGAGKPMSLTGSAADVNAGRSNIKTMQGADADFHGMLDRPKVDPLSSVRPKGWAGQGPGTVTEKVASDMASMPDPDAPRDGVPLPYGTTPIGYRKLTPYEQQQSLNRRLSELTPEHLKYLSDQVDAARTDEKGKAAAAAAQKKDEDTRKHQSDEKEKDRIAAQKRVETAASRKNNRGRDRDPTMNESSANAAMEGTRSRLNAAIKEYDRDAVIIRRYNPDNIARLPPKEREAAEKEYEEAAQHLSQTVERIHDYSEKLESDTDRYRTFVPKHKEYRYDSDEVARKFPIVKSTAKPKPREPYLEAWDRVPADIQTQMFKGARGANERDAQKKKMFKAYGGYKYKGKVYK